MENPNNRLLVTTAEAAHMLGLSKSHLEKLRHFRRDGPLVVHFGRAVRYPLAGLRAWSAAHQGGEANVGR
jgi:predicted DNA-binding transcriptional regulator AlpA